MIELEEAVKTNEEQINKLGIYMFYVYYDRLPSDFFIWAKLPGIIHFRRN